MKNLRTILVSIAIIVVFQACNSTSKSKEIEKYAYSEAKTELNEMLNKKVGSWIKEGMECYGIIMLRSPEGKIQAIKDIQAVVLIIQNDKIKMKALETVSLAPKAGCTKMGISKGETWWEEDGDLFQTREEAIAFEQSIEKEVKSPAGTKFTID